jgi:O-antigen/teichoic acid export membrane protein
MSEAASGTRIARNTVVNTLKTGAMILITVPLTPFLITKAGIEGYGIYVLATSFSALGGYLSLGELGFQAATVRYVAKWDAAGNQEEVRKVVGTTLTIFLAMGILGAALVALFALVGVDAIFNIPSHLQDETRVVFLLLAVQVPCEFGLLAFTGYLEGLQRYTTTAALTLGHIIAFGGLAVAFLLAGAGVEGIAAAAAGAALLHVVAAVATARLQRGRLRPRLGIHRDALPELFGYSWRVALIRLTSVMYDQMDKVIIGIALTPAALTIFDIANKVHLLARYALSIPSSAIIPAAAALDAAGNSEALRALLVRGTRITVALAVPITATGIILTTPLIETWLGSGYDRAVGPAQLFLVYILFTSWTTIGITMLMGVGAMNRLVVVALLAMLLNLALSIALVGPLGIEGVILGTTAGYAVINIPYLRLILDRFGLSLAAFIRGTLVRPLAVAALHAGLLLLLLELAPPEPGIPALAAAVLGLVLFGVLYIAFAADDAERAALRDLIPTRVPT